VTPAELARAYPGIPSPEAIALSCARSDAEKINALAEDANPGELLLDGSQYAPSWRRLTGGSEVWGRLGHTNPDALQVYVEELDVLTQDAGHWEDGCFWKAAA
jgi:hypothetical protein